MTFFWKFSVVWCFPELFECFYDFFLCPSGCQLKIDPVLKKVSVFLFSVCVLARLSSVCVIGGYVALLVSVVTTMGVEVCSYCIFMQLEISRGYWGTPNISKRMLFIFFKLLVCKFNAQLFHWWSPAVWKLLQNNLFYFQFYTSLC